MHSCCDSAFSLDPHFCLLPRSPYLRPFEATHAAAAVAAAPAAAAAVAAAAAAAAAAAPTVFRDGFLQSREAENRSGERLALFFVSRPFTTFMYTYNTGCYAEM